MKFLDVPQSGKLGVVVAQQGRFGQIKRALGLTANPRTPAQMSVRRIFASVSQRWKALTSAQQLAWINAASAYQSATHVGQSGTLTGLQLFAKQNCINRQFGHAEVDTPSQQPVFPDLAPANLVAANAGGVISLKLTCPADPGENTVVRAAKPQSNGRWSIPSCQILGTCPAPVLGSSDITALYTARFGAPVAGDKIFVQVNIELDGHESIPAVFTATVPAST